MPDAPQSSLERLEKTFEANALAAVRELLQKKHLYQNVRISTDEVIRQAQEGARQPLDAAAINEVRRLAAESWQVEDSYRARNRQIHGRAVEKRLEFVPPDVKLFCTSCDRVEAFGLVGADDAPWSYSDRTKPSTFRSDLQAFVLTYVCQSCHAPPEVFLLRRDGEKVTLCGRAPIEHVDVPRVIPKSIRSYVGDSRVAHNSGQTLAAVFLLRVAIEQWARNATGLDSTYADDVIDAYMESLPQDFSARFPSVRSLYKDLSAAVHKAEASASLFERAHTELIEHFDARRLFRLDEVTKRGP